MNRGKLIIHETATSRSTTDENSYVPVKFPKNTGIIGGKVKSQSYTHKTIAEKIKDIKDIIYLNGEK